MCALSLLNAGPFTDVGTFSLNASFSFLLILLQTELHINSRSQKVDDKCFFNITLLCYTQIQLRVHTCSREVCKE